ncbi:hypothetical protein BJ322DRAFT_1218987 [Thelephora terrestris]|uniref:Uncharacterized protein n=1 Tax=Thelephora terrestris TaxID=56493 RepID=A0A9P6HEN3_9AGAM|nr:hypothetical protein BJ322DRAFT_1218987 [Thelephora terrestris]
MRVASLGKRGGKVVGIRDLARTEPGWNEESVPGPIQSQNSHGPGISDLPVKQTHSRPASSSIPDAQRMPTARQRLIKIKCPPQHHSGRSGRAGFLFPALGPDEFAGDLLVAVPKAVLRLCREAKPNKEVTRYVVELIENMLETFVVPAKSGCYLDKHSSEVEGYLPKVSDFSNTDTKNSNVTSVLGLISTSDLVLLHTEDEAESGVQQRAPNKGKLRSDRGRGKREMLVFNTMQQSQLPTVQTPFLTFVSSVKYILLKLRQLHVLYWLQAPQDRQLFAVPGLWEKVRIKGGNGTSFEANSGGRD